MELLAAAGGDPEVSGQSTGYLGASVFCAPGGASGQRSLPKVPRTRRPHPQSTAAGQSLLPSCLKLLLLHPLLQTGMVAKVQEEGATVPVKHMS